MIVLELVIVLFIGLALGSFTTALVHRVPRSIPWWSSQRSECPSCHHTLSVPDLVPVFSWLFSRGKCRYCGQGISRRYPVVELCTAMACFMAYAVYGLTVPAFFIMAAVPFLMALLVIDLDHLILPDQLVLILAVLGLARLVFIVLTGEWMLASPFVLGMLVYAAVAWVLGYTMTKILQKDALGFGDVKFFAVAGLWLGMGAFSWFLLLSGVFGVVLGLVWRKIRGEGAFPFGPALIAAFYVLLLFGGSLFA